MREVDQSQSRPEFWAVLGGVRFMLAMIVFFVHLGTKTHLPYVLTKIGNLSAPTAVFCFLILSGFSIAHSIQRNPHQFYRRRFLRLYPLYFLMVIVSGHLAQLPGSPLWTCRADIVTNLLLMQTFTGRPLIADVVVWSLGLEAIFYVLAPIFHRMSTPAILLLAGASAATYLIYPLIGGSKYYAWMSHGHAAVFLGWMWLAGFIYYRYQQQAWAGILLLSTMIAMTTMSRFCAEPWEELTIVIAIGLLVGGRSIVMNPATRKFLDYLGNLTFPLYLVHFPVFCVCCYTLHIENYFVMSISALILSMVALQIEPWLRGVFSSILDESATAISRLIQGGRRLADRISIAGATGNAMVSGLQLINAGEL